MAIEYDLRLIGFINIFEKISRAKVKDCFEEEGVLVFVVQQGEARKAIGKGGETVKKLSDKFRKKLKIIEFNNDPKIFIRNLLFPLKPKVELKEDHLVIVSKDNKEKGQIFGREKSRLKKLQAIVKKYFKVEVKVE
jgi:transcription termination/antitermination protein NusA